MCKWKTFWSKKLTSSSKHSLTAMFDLALVESHDFVQNLAKFKTQIKKISKYEWEILAVIPSKGRFTTKKGYGKQKLMDAFDDTSHFCDLKP